jgi:lipid II:glycine glycyltransferase (peptidoglycan interpeptide bridge formation enzyme)
LNQEKPNKAAITSMTKRQRYTQFCQNNPDLPIFFQDWYLDACCGENGWDVLMFEKNGAIQGVWTFFIKQKAGFRYVTMPPFVKFMGPWIAPGKKEAETTSILAALHQQLPKMADWKQDFHYQFQTPDFLQKMAYRIAPKYSYRLDLSDFDQVWAGVNRNMRRNIAKAKTQVEISIEADPELFYQINRLSFERQGLSIPYSREAFLRHDTALAQKKQRTIFFARDQRGQVHSASYLIWDQASSYYHLSGDDPALRKSGAGLLLTWEAIRYSKEVLALPIFDFEGSMLPKVEVIRQQFGGVKTPYFYAEKNFSVLYRLLESLKRSFFYPK